LSDVKKSVTALRVYLVSLTEMVLNRLREHDTGSDSPSKVFNSAPDLLEPVYSVEFYSPGYQQHIHRAIYFRTSGLWVMLFNPPASRTIGYS
jgi:hypothetical protein